MATGMRDEPVSPDHEYVVAYAKSRSTVVLFGTARSETDYPLGDAKGKYRSTDLTVGMTKDMRPNQYYAIRNPRTGHEFWPAENRVWRFQPSTMQMHIHKDNIIWPDEEPAKALTRPRFKTRFDTTEAGSKLNPVSTWMDTGRTPTAPDVGEGKTILTAGMNQEGTKQLKDLFGAQVLEYPKPVSLLKSLVALGTSSGDVILDFFAGSATTAQAVLQMNREDRGSRRFIMIQLPEPSGDAALPTIADIGKERIRRLIQKMQADSDSKLPLDANREDLGFRVFKLSQSNFRAWNSTAPRNSEQLEQQLDMHIHHIQPHATQESILTEILLKSGFELTAPVEQVTVASAACFSVAGGLLLVCLEETVTEETIRGMIALGPQQFVCLDSAFHGNDQLKTNTVLQMRDADIVFHTV